MIIVTGTKRSGTSMWMQVFKAAGLPLIGEAYMGPWERSIKEANPRGFYESRFRNGIFYATNPDPKTGHFVPPQDSRLHVVKVFIPGLVRTDLAYTGRVLATVRDWRAYATSVKRLYEMEDRWLVNEGVDPDTGISRLEQARTSRPAVHPAVEWWFENYELIRDLVCRRYPFHLTTYEKVLADPDAQIRKVLTWVGAGDADAAIAAVAATLRTQEAREDLGPVLAEEAGLSAEEVEVFDAYFQAVHAAGHLPTALVTRMNALQHTMEERYGKPSKERKVR